MTTTLIAPAQTIVRTEPVNVRDLGGLPIAGGVLRRGVALRADDLSTVTAEYAERLVAGGMSAVIDLRSAEEVAHTGRGPLAATGIGYHHLPFMASLDASASASHWRDPRQFGGFYAAMFESAAPSIVAALAIIAVAPGTVAFHCAAGKDRTGVLAAALLLTLGADDETVVADYGRTEANIVAIHERLAPVMQVVMARLGIDLDAAAQAAASDLFSAQAMVDALALLRARHTDPLAPLRAAGLSDGLVASLRRRALVG